MLGKHVQLGGSGVTLSKYLGVLFSSTQREEVDTGVFLTCLPCTGAQMKEYHASPSVCCGVCREDHVPPWLDILEVQGVAPDQDSVLDQILTRLLRVLSSTLAHKTLRPHP